jgi:enoyl-CoA hydratase/carnithine racemase
VNFEQIKYEVKEQVLTITLNRPDKLNAFTRGMKNELIKAFDLADQDDEVRVVIVTGAGRAFCAGQDLSAGIDTFEYKTQSIEEHRDIGGLLTLRIFEMKKPMIAAINGPAVGIGITMTLPMDVRIASENAKIGFVFTRRGLVPEACSGWFLPRLVGMSRAMEWVLTGRVFLAKEALEGGLVSQVVRPDQLLIKAQELAREIADNTSAVSVALSRQILWRMWGADHPMLAHQVDSRCVFYMGKSPDCYEGVTAFREKRRPLFKMKPSQDMPDFYPWWEDRHFR